MRISSVDMELVLGILAAAGASTLYSLGIALQAMDAKQAPKEEHLRVALAWGLVRQGRWLFGTGLSILGFPLQVVALMLAPLVVVQPALAAGLLVLMVAGEHMLDERPGRYEYCAVVAIVLGVIGTALCAPANSAHVTDVLTTASFSPCSPGRPDPLRDAVLRPSPVRGNDVLCGLCLRLQRGGDQADGRRPPRGQHRTGAPLGVEHCRCRGRRNSQRDERPADRPAIQVAPVVFVTQTAIPVALAPLLFGEYFDTTPLGGVPLIASLLVLVIGAGALARSPCCWP